MSINKKDKNIIKAKFLVSFIHKKAKRQVLDVDLIIPNKGVTAIYGSSGSGKTTLLRCIAGLQQAKNSTLIVGDETWQSETSFLPTHKRQIGYVFQESSLLPHLTAKGNLNFALKRAGAPINKALNQQIIDILGIGHILEQYPEQLSGGERQRVAIARALFVQPKILLMDEPLASIDAIRKLQFLSYLNKLHKTLNIPVLYVTHSLDEVAQLADQVVLLDSGRCVAQGAVTEVFSNLNTVVSLEEAGVIVEAKVIEHDTNWHLSKLYCENTELWVRDGGDNIGDIIRIRILAKDISIALQKHDDSSILNRIYVEVTKIEQDRDDAMVLTELKFGKQILVARITKRSANNLALHIGQNVWAQIKSIAILR